MTKRHTPARKATPSHADLSSVPVAKHVRPEPSVNMGGKAAQSPPHLATLPSPRHDSATVGAVIGLLALAAFLAIVAWHQWRGSAEVVEESHPPAVAAVVERAPVAQPEPVAPVVEAQPNVPVPVRPVPVVHHHRRPSRSDDDATRALNLRELRRIEAPGFWGALSATDIGAYRAIAGEIGGARAR